MPSTADGPRLPSAKWLSFDGWDYHGMKERLEAALQSINKPALLSHAKQVLRQDASMSEPFSAGQYWVCFEVVASDRRLVIARVRLPRHPDAPSTVSDEDAEYSTQCELATMKYVQSRLPSVRIPEVYAYEPAGSPKAAAVGAPYMLIQGFYANTLSDVEFDMTVLPADTQKRIMKHWARAQAELATLTLPRIGSISSLSDTGEPVVGKLASASLDAFQSPGPFARASDYFLAASQALLATSPAAGADGTTRWARLGAAALRAIVSRTRLFDDPGPFPLSHMDLGAQNLLVDGAAALDVVAVIDWEFAQAAPWPVHRYPMPFPLLGSPAETARILADAGHVAHANERRQAAARAAYAQAFREAEEELRREGRPLARSPAEVLDGTASRVYACFANLGRVPQGDEALVKRMLGMAFGWDDERIKSYLADLEMTL